MPVTKELYGEFKGKKVYLFTLTNEKNTFKAKVLNYGGIIKSLVYDGVDVVLGRDTFEQYLENDGYYGALIGRNSNRIFRSKFSVNGIEYQLAENDGKNNLHGGINGFNQKVCDYEIIDEIEPSLVLSFVSPDMEEGFPGNVCVKVTYTVTNEDSIKIHYEASTDKDTIINLTNHSYFNLNGHNSGNVNGHILKVNSSYFTPNTDECLPDGSIIKNDGTPFDLRCGKKLGDVFESQHPQIKEFDGFDHNFVLDGNGFKKIAEAKGDITGICMDCYTDLSGVQIYTGNKINNTKKCKDGTIYDVHQAFCLETQAFPNAVNYPHFPSPIVKKDEMYETTTEYRFYK